MLTAWEQDFIDDDWFFCEGTKKLFRIAPDGPRGAWGVYDLTGEEERLMGRQATQEGAMKQVTAAYAARKEAGNASE